MEDERKPLTVEQQLQDIQIKLDRIMRRMGIADMQNAARGQQNSNPGLQPSSAYWPSWTSPNGYFGP